MSDHEQDLSKIPVEQKEKNGFYVTVSNISSAKYHNTFI
jgi:hypothetical protein